MKSIIVVLMVVFFASQTALAQPTTYLSDLEQPSVGAAGIGSNEWWAVAFTTGTNAGGYSLDSFQLSMADEYSVGDRPSGFTVMLYNDGPGGLRPPENSLMTLDGSADPSTAGIYTYTPPSNLTLSPGGFYSMVVTANTPALSNFGGGPGFIEMYRWNFMTATNPSVYNPSDGWYGLSAFYSQDGVNWSQQLGTFIQYAITAEPVPEPGVLSLIACGAYLFIWRCRKII